MYLPCAQSPRSPSFILILFISAAPQVCRSADPPEAAALARIRRDAKAMHSFVRTELGRRFLAATDDLPTIATRVIFRDKPANAYFTEEAAQALPKERFDTLERKEYDEEYYYNTRYGTPLAYARALDLLSQNGLGDVSGKRLLDYGYGPIGQLRLLASLGADAVGVEVDPLLPVLYGFPGDQGTVKGRFGRDGSVTLVHGRFPADDTAKAAVGTGFDLFISKNTLKNGYLHPERPVDERRLVKTGVEDRAFVQTLYEILRPGGFALIYNLSPAPAPPDQPYIPWADGRCPFPREMWESAGFQVLEFDRDDSTAARTMGKILGWDQGEGAMDLEKGLFGQYTLSRKPAPK